MYRTCSELAEEKGEIDQLLGLLKEEENSKDELNYSAKNEVPNSEDGSSSSSRITGCGCSGGGCVYIIIYGTTSL